MSYTSGVFLKGSPSSRVGLLLFGYIGKKAGGGIKNNNILHPKRIIELETTTQ
jgi:hypothetical protein